MAETPSATPLASSAFDVELEGLLFSGDDGNGAWLWFIINATIDMKKMREAKIAAKPFNDFRRVAGGAAEEGCSSGGRGM